MSWKRWKLGLLIATLSGLADGAVVLFIDPNVAIRGLLIGVAVFIFKAMGLFLKQHPVETISLETTIIEKKDVTP